MGDIERDETLDVLRGLAMIEVLFVHSLYWTNCFSLFPINILKSFLLFEMPLFFFVTGAVNGITTITNIKYFYKKRIKKIIIPYWFFALICLFVNTIKSFILKDMPFTEYVKMAFSWLIPIVTPMTRFGLLPSSLWFIPIYCSIILIIPLLQKINKTKFKYWFIVILIIALIITDNISVKQFFVYDYIKEVLFYGFWTYIGLFYSKNKNFFISKYRLEKIVIIIIFSIFSVCLNFFGKYKFDMQINKFPPNIMFFTFSVVSMTLILLMFPLINRINNILKKTPKINFIVHSFQKNSLYIFLYQAIIFTIINHAITIVELQYKIAYPYRDILVVIISFISSVFLCAYIGEYLSKLEKKILKL